MPIFFGLDKSKPYWYGREKDSEYEVVDPWSSGHVEGQNVREAIHCGGGCERERKQEVSMIERMDGVLQAIKVALMNAYRRNAESVCTRCRRERGCKFDNEELVVST